MTSPWLWIPAFAGMTLEYRIGLLAREGTVAETSRMDRNLALEAVRVTEADVVFVAVGDALHDRHPRPIRGA